MRQHNKKSPRNRVPQGLPGGLYTSKTLLHTMNRRDLPPVINQLKIHGRQVANPKDGFVLRQRQRFQRHIRREGLPAADGVIPPQGSVSSGSCCDCAPTTPESMVRVWTAPNKAHPVTNNKTPNQCLFIR